MNIKRPLCRFAGGKTKLAKPIIEKLLQLKESNGLKHYAEPFFGGGSIGCNLLSMTEFHSVWLNDKDESLAALWKAVATNPRGLWELVKEYKPTAESFYKLKEELSDPEILEYDDLSNGFKRLVLHQISFSGLALMAGSPIGGREQKSKWKVDCRWNPETLNKKIQEYSEILNSSLVKITCLDFMDVLDECGEDWLAYLDPPYLEIGNDLYPVGLKELEHMELARALRNAKFKWLLSYDDHPTIRSLYSWAKIEEIGNINTIVTKGKKDNIKTELLISNA